MPGTKNLRSVKMGCELINIHAEEKSSGKFKGIYQFLKYKLSARSFGLSKFAELCNFLLHT
jgi:hypothetical protein